MRAKKLLDHINFANFEFVILQFRHANGDLHIAAFETFHCQGSELLEWHPNLGQLRLYFLF